MCTQAVQACHKDPMDPKVNSTLYAIVFAEKAKVAAAARQP